MQTAIVSRLTVEEIVAKRNKALALYAQAHTDIANASATLGEAADYARQATRAEITRYNHHNGKANDHFMASLTVPDRQKFLDGARRHTDTNVWSHLISVTDLERLMDKKAKDQFCQQLLLDPPEVTVDNVCATLEQFALDASMIFKRGIAECFSSLDRRFKSHDGWKLEAVSFSLYMFDVNGWWNWNNGREDTLRDIERAFMVIDGRPVPETYAGIVGELRNKRHRKDGATQTVVESEFFTVRCFKNGNAHVWFKRDDLVDKVNQILGDYYNHGIPQEKEYEDDGGLHEPKRTLAKNAGWFPTPKDAAERLIEKASLHRRYDDKSTEPLRVLEPSAGEGSLAVRCREKGAEVSCVEIHPERAHTLRAHGFPTSQVDFLSLAPPIMPRIDRAVMNPPFDRERDIDHVMHALKFLKPDGLLVAIMSASTEFRETRKSIAFRELMTKMNAEWEDLPPGSFASSGTYTNTIILRVWKDGRSRYN